MNKWEYNLKYVRGIDDVYDQPTFVKNGAEYGCYEIEDYLNQMEGDMRTVLSQITGKATFDRFELSIILDRYSNV